MKIRVFLFLLFFSYSPLLFAQNLVITLDWLDRAWADREIPAKQKIYINYIQALRVNNIVANDYESAWKVARMVYFLGNYGIGEEQFAHSKAGIEFFNYGVILAKKAIELNPDCIEAQYWYAVNLGSYGLVKGVMSAAINAKSGMKALKFVLKHNSDYQWGGASRILGKYYIKLPTMFGGDQAKAKESLIRATKDFNFSNNFSTTNHTNNLNFFWRCLIIFFF